MPKSHSGVRRKTKNEPVLASEMKDIKPTAEYKQEVLVSFEKELDDVGNMLGSPITEKADGDRVNRALREIMTSEDTHVGIRFPESKLDAILDSGRFKSQFETGDSQGSFSPYFRASVEHKEMSYSENMMSEKRPVYGMLFNYKNPSEVKASSGAGQQYGNVVAIMKPSIKAHSTITGHDSLDVHGHTMPVPMLRPTWHMLGTGHSHNHISVLIDAVRAVRKGKPLTVSIFDRHRYAEAQIHGGTATVSNIQHLIFGGNPPSPAQVARLSRLGITWSLEGENTIH